MKVIKALLTFALLFPISGITEKLSAFAINLNSDEIELSINESLPLTPASTAKLFGIYGALKQFGPDYTYSYDAYISSQSDLTLVIPPDPLFTTETVYKLTERIKALGVPLRSLILDISKIQGGRSRVGSRAYESAIKGVFFNFNSVEISACDLSKRQTILTFPTWAGISTSGSISNKKESPPLQADCRGFQCIVSGSIAPDSVCQSIYRSVDEPEYYLQRSFAKSLKESGVLVSQGVKISNSTEIKLEKRVFSYESRPLHDALRAAAHFSTNLIAEANAFLLGSVEESDESKATYSYNRGIETLNKILNEISDGRAEVLIDGSGLAHENKISTLSLATLLKKAYQDKRINYDFISLLPVGGESGTLKIRNFGEATPYVRAKTGSLDGVSSLAGYVINKKGDVIAFAIIQNEFSDLLEAKKREEKIVEKLY